MTYEEKRELRLQISQMLADAGLNQKSIKDMVDEELRKKIDRALTQRLNSLDGQCSSGNYIEEQVSKIFNSSSMNYHISQIVKEELKNRIIQVVIKNAEKVE